MFAPDSSKPTTRFNWCDETDLKMKKDNILLVCRAQWLRGRASGSRLRGPGFESCPEQVCSLRCINEYLAIDSGGYEYEYPSRIICSIWLDASQRSRDGV